MQSLHVQIVNVVYKQAQEFQVKTYLSKLKLFFSWGRTYCFYPDMELSKGLRNSFFEHFLFKCFHCSVISEKTEAGHSKSLSFQEESY